MAKNTSMAALLPQAAKQRGKPVTAGAPAKVGKADKTDNAGKPVKPAVVTRTSHEIRIIGGQWKRTRLQVADKPGLRPTPDRVRETLFNWLGQDLNGRRCIDAFAGTGVLGFEAASRGAGHVLLVEQDTVLLAGLQRVRDKLQALCTEIRRGDGVTLLAQTAPSSVDLVFIDPPFDAALWDKALRAAAAALRPTGYVYLEAPEAWSDARVADNGLVLHRHLKAGAVHAHLLRKAALPHA